MCFGTIFHILVAPAFFCKVLSIYVSQIIFASFDSVPRLPAHFHMSAYLSEFLDYPSIHCPELSRSVLRNHEPCEVEYLDAPILHVWSVQRVTNLNYESNVKLKINNLNP